MKQIFKTLSSIKKDKLLHSFYGCLLYALVPYSPIISLSIVFAIAVIKEIIDEYEYGGFDLADIFYTIVIPIFLTIKGIVWV